MGAFEFDFSGPDAYRFDPSEFSGTLRLFPLPHLVQFPGTVLPIHIFEPRYRALVAAALEADRLIGMVLLKPGWERDPSGAPPIHEVACLTRIVHEVRLADGRYNLLLMGLRRARILAQTSQSPYPMALVQLMEDQEPEPDSEEADEMAGSLWAIYRGLLPAAAGAGSILPELPENIPLGLLADVLASVVDLELPLKQELLEQAHVLQRSRRLLEAYRASPEHHLRWLKGALVRGRRADRQSLN